MSAPKGFILAAGLGTRLRPLTHRVAKPAMDFFGLPMAAYTLNSLFAAGVREFVINLHHLPESVKCALLPHLPRGAAVSWSEERGEILGTGGAVIEWLDFMTDNFFLANGDTYRGFDAGGLLDFHRAAGAIATLSLAPAPEGVEAPVEMSSGGRIESFLGAKRPDYRRGRPMLFTGMHFFSGEAVPRFRAVGKKSFCVNREVNAHMVAEGLPVYGYWPAGGYFWSDLGTPQSYLGAHAAMLGLGKCPPDSGGRLVLRDESTPEGGLVLAPAWLGRGAEVRRGAEAGPFAVLGADSAVLPGVKIRNSVAWSGVTVERDADGAILAGFETVFALSGGER